MCKSRRISIDFRRVSGSFRSAGASSILVKRTKTNVAHLLVVCSGPYRFQEELVATLDQANAIGTFFVNGKNCELITQKAPRVSLARSGWLIVVTFRGLYIRPSGVTSSGIR
jgi:hypothetical protein